MAAAKDLAVVNAVRPLPLGEHQIGALLIDAGKLRPEHAEQILRAQKERGLRFGEAAVTLGLVTESDVQQVLSTQFSYSYLHNGDAGISREVVAAYEPFSGQVERLRALRSQLLLRWVSPDRRMLAVVSPGRGDGRSYFAANLAVVFSQLGERTLLIDADMRRSRQHLLFNLPNRAGLSTRLAGRDAGDEVRRIPGLLHLSVLPAGPTPPNPLELIARSSFSRLVEEVAQEFDVVIVDTPAAEASSDGQTIAVRSGGALLLARRNRSRPGDLLALSHAITTTGGQIVGAVLNNY